MADSTPDNFPIPRAAIWIICIFAPIMGGSVLYYAWKSSAPEAARYANRASWIAFLVILIPCFAYGVVQSINAHHVTPTDAGAAVHDPP